MSATDFDCPTCNRLRGQVCVDPRGIARWGYPHPARLALHRAAMKERHESKTLYMRVHSHPSGPDVDYSTDSPIRDAGMLLYTHGALMRRSYTATDTQRKQWASMDEADTPTMSWEPNVEYRRYCLKELHAAAGYAIVHGALRQSVMDFRVVNLRDGDESAIYTLEQCRDIITLARLVGLKDSFA